MTHKELANMWYDYRIENGVIQKGTADGWEITWTDCPLEETVIALVAMVGSLQADVSRLQEKLRAV